MGRNTSISLGNHFEEFVNHKIGTGRYNSASEVIRAGLRLLEEEEQKIEALRQALDDGESGGFVKDYDPKEHLGELHRKNLK